MKKVAILAIASLLALGIVLTLFDVLTRRDRLLDAARDGNIGKITALVEKDVPIDCTTAGPRHVSGQTPLMLAARYGHRDVVEYLLVSGANPTACDAMGRTPLVWAIIGKNHSIITTLVDAYPEALHLEIEPFGGILPLHLAVLAGCDSSTLELMLEAGADPNAVSPSGDTALHEAALSGSVDQVAVLLKYGGDPLFMNDNEETPRQVATDRGDAVGSDIIELFDGTTQTSDQ